MEGTDKKMDGSPDGSPAAARPPEDGGPAFPQGIDQGASEAGFPIVEHTGGMTLRDYFAAKSLQGLMVRFTESGYNDIAATTEAYRIADAMIQARKGRA